jgi:hypothetical protein
MGHRGIDMIKKFTIVMIISMSSLLILMGCGKQIFDGSSTGNDEQFIIDYSIMNCTKANDMKLEEGVKIDVVIENKSGHLDILIANSNGEKIYKGDDVTSGKFSIEMPETDTYKFSVTGKNAKGNVSFKVVK